MKKDMRKNLALFVAVVVSTATFISATNGTILCDGEHLVVNLLFGAVGVQVVLLVSWCVIALEKKKTLQLNIIDLLYVICALITLMVQGFGILGQVVCFLKGHITFKGFVLMVDAMAISSRVFYLMDATDDQFNETAEEKPKCEKS